MLYVIRFAQTRTKKTPVYLQKFCLDKMQNEKEFKLELSATTNLQKAQWFSRTTVENFLEEALARIGLHLFDQYSLVPICMVFAEKENQGICTAYWLSTNHTLTQNPSYAKYFKCNNLEELQLARDFVQHFESHGFSACIVGDPKFALKDKQL